MKTYKNIIKTTTLLAVMAAGMVSCNDFLTVYPQDKITEETFWEDKRDLEGVRYAAYKQLSTQVERMIVWGDLRSDAYKLNTVLSSQQGNRDKYRNMIQANIDTTWSDYDWSGMYSVIGYCNKVIAHGQEVLDKDKQFTQSEWTQMRAEMVTLRSLAYFYLVRAFRNVPYTTKVVTSDSEVEYFPQLPGIDVMDSLIRDMHTVENQARNRFTSISETKGMITNSTIDVLIADLYLWRASLLEGKKEDALAVADYQQAIEYSKRAICKLGDQFDEETKNSMSSREGYISWASAPDFGRATGLDFMYRNKVESANLGSFSMRAYDYIFDFQNSYESFFELQFNSSDSRENGTVNSMWGSGSSVHLVTTFAEDNRQDMRYWFSAWKGIEGQKDAQDWYCLKWRGVVALMTEYIGKENVKVEVSTTDSKYNNWIIYRLSDALLIEAEAAGCLAELGIDKDNNTELCNKLMMMVNRRWYIDVQNGGEIEFDLSKEFSKDPLKSYETDFYGTSKITSRNNNLVKNVMKTRLIEFMGEGKRWFDLVRWAERNNQDCVKHETDPSKDEDPGMREMFKSFMNNITGFETIRNRCTNMWGLYCPIYYMEIKAYRAGGASDKITQNPIWNKSKYDR